MKFMKPKLIFCLALVLSGVISKAFAADEVAESANYSFGLPSKDSPEVKWWRDSQTNLDERLAWWRDARFGMFIHWGVYSGLGNQFHGKQGGGFRCAFVFKKAQGDQRAFLFTQARHGFFQKRRELTPDIFRIRIVQGGLHIGLLFAGLLSGARPQKLAGGEPRGLIQPAGEGGPLAQARGFLGEDAEVERLDAS